jgi:hypothetical protein
LLSSFSLFFAHKLSVYSIIVDKQVTSFDPKIGWDKSLAKAIDGTGNLYYKLHAHGYHQICRSGSSNCHSSLVIISTIEHPGRTTYIPTPDTSVSYVSSPIYGRLEPPHQKTLPAQIPYGRQYSSKFLVSSPLYEGRVDGVLGRTGWISYLLIAECFLPIAYCSSLISRHSALITDTYCLFIAAYNTYSFDPQ